MQQLQDFRLITRWRQCYIDPRISFQIIDLLNKKYTDEIIQNKIEEIRTAILNHIYSIGNDVHPLDYNQLIQPLLDKLYQEWKLSNPNNQNKTFDDFLLTITNFINYYVYKPSDQILNDLINNVQNDYTTNYALTLISFIWLFNYLHNNKTEGIHPSLISKIQEIKDNLTIDNTKYEIVKKSCLYMDYIFGINEYYIFNPYYTKIVPDDDYNQPEDIYKYPLYIPTLYEKIDYLINKVYDIKQNNTVNWITLFSIENYPAIGPLDISFIEFRYNTFFGKFKLLQGITGITYLFAITNEKNELILSLYLQKIKEEDPYSIKLFIKYNETDIDITEIENLNEINDYIAQYYIKFYPDKLILKYKTITIEKTNLLNSIYKKFKKMYLGLPIKNMDSRYRYTGYYNICIGNYSDSDINVLLNQ